ncbi:UNVERIFIED_CONTAM: hypothetical protein Sangu_2227500 [Sesamum angustifolium]|uniref:Uncharacterized protein n=1 Tax=Sesamum angustifolium TaxID=2727405 RepID=A0AAW2L3H9_9LAMI
MTILANKVAPIYDNAVTELFDNLFIRRVRYLRGYWSSRPDVDGEESDPTCDNEPPLPPDLGGDGGV